MIGVEEVGLAVIGVLGCKLAWEWRRLNKKRKKRNLNQELAKQYSNAYVAMMQRAYRKRQEFLQQPGVKDVRAALEGRDLIIVVTKVAEK